MSFSGLNLSTDFQERDVVFGGDTRLARAIEEADALFPHHQGLTLLSTCPVALIGDDVDAVAKRQARRLGQPVVPVHCAGFRRGDGIGDTHRTITTTWRDWAAPTHQPKPRSVTLLCREMGGAWRGISQLLTELGLEVTTTWPAASSRAEVGRLGNSRLTISVGMEYWARLLERQFGLSWVEADFLGPRATCETLRAIAARFEEPVRDCAEALIAAQAPAAHAVVQDCRARVAGRLYFSFAPLQPRDVTAFAEAGLRVGSALQGWPDRAGRWHVLEARRWAQDTTPAEVRAMLKEVEPDAVDGLGQDGLALRKAGYGVLDEWIRAQLARASTGFEGAEQLARQLLILFDSPVRRLCRWQGEGP